MTMTVTTTLTMMTMAMVMRTTGITLNGQNTNVVLGFFRFIFIFPDKLKSTVEKCQTYAVSVIKDFLLYMF